MVTMLAEYGYHQFASPSWSRDLTVYDDTETALQVCGDEVQLDLQTVELIDGVLSEQGTFEHLNLLVDNDDTCSMGTSHLSSEFDEDGTPDASTGDPSEMYNDDDATDRMFDTEALTSCLNINSLQEITVQDIASLNGMETFVESMLGCPPLTSNTDIVSDDDGSNDSRSSSQSSGTCPCPTVSSPHKRRRRKRNLDHLPWSELSYDEHQTLLETISASVSDVLGPREQLELLRIIDPDVQSLPADGQFTIEPDFLDNEKLDKIRKLIDSHTAKNQPHIGARSTSSNSTQGRTRNSLPKSSQKKKQSKELKHQRKVLRQQQRREYKQNLKEKRSGLFQKEEVLALESHIEEEEEIDILG